MDSYLGQRWNLLGFFGSGARCRLPADPCRQALARSRAAATARGTHSHQYPSAPTRGDWSLDPQTSLSHAVGHSGLCFFFLPGFKETVRGLHTTPAAYPLCSSHPVTTLDCVDESQET